MERLPFDAMLHRRTRRLHKGRKANALEAQIVTDNASEAHRLEALHALSILDTGAEAAFDRIAALASRLFQAPLAVVAFVDAQRVWHKAVFGTTIQETERIHSFCTHTIEQPDVLIVPDLAKDSRFATNPYVTSGTARFYAGAPVTTPGGLRIGAVCVLDIHPRPGLTDDERQTLTDLAFIVMTHVESRRTKAALIDLEMRRARTDGMLAQIHDAATCEDALTAILADLTIFHGGRYGHLYKLLTPETGLREVTCFSRDGSPGPHTAEALQLSLTSRNSLTIQTILRGTATCVRYVGNMSGYPLAVAMAQRGAKGAVIQPAIIGANGFALILTFDTDRDDLETVAQDLTALMSGLNAALHRKDAEDRLRLLMKALDSAHDGVMITEVEPIGARGPHVVYVNEGFTRMNGYGSAELLGQSLQTLQQTGQVDQTLAFLLGTTLPVQPGRTVSLHYDRDGVPMWVEIDLMPVTDEAGAITNWISIQRDITARKLAEQERQERDASFRLLFDNNPQPMLLYDPTTYDIVEVNSAAADAYGRTKDRFVHRSILDMAPSEDRLSMQLFIDRLGDGPSTSIWSHVRANGDRIRVQAVTHSLTFAGRRARLAVFWDVTEIERARDALRQSNQELLVLAGQLQTRTADLTEVNRRARLGMWRLPFDDEPAEWSDETFEMFGREKQSPAPSFETILEWIDESDRARVEDAVAIAAELRMEQTFEFRVIHPDGSVRHCLADLRPESGPGDRLLALKGFCQDITERKETELALLRSEKLKTIGQFTGGVAHDFNNLLTVMTLNLEEAIETLPLDHPLQGLLAPALHAALRGSELTSQLLSYALRSPLDPKPVSLQDLLDQLKPLLDRILGERFTLVIQHRDGVVQPFVDSAKLENALLNLVINARDSMAKGGRIVINTSLTTLNAENVGTLTDVRPGEYALITVTDTGSGIAPDVFSRVFEPFFTTKAAGKGSGLGLSMVYGFAKQSGGHATIASEVGVGTTASLYLPIWGIPRAAARQRIGPKAQDAAPRGRALLVEDQPAVLETVRRQLLALGFHVLTAADADSAMVHISTAGTLDLLFSDVAIPGPMDGIQLAAMARGQHPDIRILLTSGYVEQAPITSDAESRMEFLQKPYSRGDLAAKLNAMFAAAELLQR
jgi:PAS domain S-box-containing protein